ncbi:MAG: peptide chain release factor-like protein [Candidatus Dormibacteria bacterium]
MDAGIEQQVSQVVDVLLEHATFTASRSSGPGGQRRDKVSTRAELVIGASALEALDPHTAKRVGPTLGLESSDLRITSQEDRMLARNRQICVERLTELVAAALAPPATVRRPTRPTRSSVRVRVEGKKQRSTVKRLRQPPSGD